MLPSPQIQLIASRSYPFIETESLEQGHAHEALLRELDGTFFLYFSERVGSLRSRARFVHIEAREALIWINQPSDGLGSFWD
jgi:hypothetical protein